MGNAKNRLNWDVEWNGQRCDFRVVTASGRDALGVGYPTEAAAQEAIRREVQRRDKRNQRAKRNNREHAALMSSLGMRRTRSGGWE